MRADCVANSPGERGRRIARPDGRAAVTAPFEHGDVLSLDGVRSAQTRIGSHVRRTATVRSHGLSELLGTNVYLKLEMFQKTGAFKVRGAFNKMLTLTARQKRGGIVAASAGNHAQAVAFAARELAMRAVIMMPESTPRNYLNATRAYGAKVCLVDSLSDAFVRVPEYQARGWTYIHPFADPLVIAGQGTLGLEILDDVPDLTDVIVSIGGGGLAGGVALAIKPQRPPVRVWGVETVGADAMAQALSAGRVVELAQATSVAHTLCAPAVAETTLALAQQYLEDVVVVSDRDALAALRFLLEREKVLTEAASSCTLAAAELLRNSFTSDDHVVLVLCGGNVALEEIIA